MIVAIDAFDLDILVFKVICTPWSPAAGIELVFHAGGCQWSTARSTLFEYAPESIS